MTALMSMHVTAGTVGLVTGFVALATAKGAPVHRRAGVAFVVAMLAMTATAGFVMAATGDVYDVNLIAIALTSYLVATAYTAVHPQEYGGGWLERGAPIMGLGVGVTALVLGFDTAASDAGSRQGIPPFPFFMFGTVGVIGGVLDLRRRRRPLDARGRLTRHLWRMSFALFIAAMSFFLGQARVIPEPIRIMPVLALPPLLVLGTMLYWLWRVKMRGRLLAKPLQPVRGRPVTTAASS